MNRDNFKYWILSNSDENFPNVLAISREYDDDTIIVLIPFNFYGTMSDYVRLEWFRNEASTTLHASTTDFIKWGDRGADALIGFDENDSHIGKEIPREYANLAPWLSSKKGDTFTLDEVRAEVRQQCSEFGGAAIYAIDRYRNTKLESE